MGGTRLKEPEFSTNNPTFTGRATFEEIEVTTDISINPSITGIVASTIQTQGQQELVGRYNEVTTVANVDDVVSLPPQDEGVFMTVTNKGANRLQVFPGLGDSIGDNPVNTSIFLEPATTLSIYCADPNWIITSLATGQIVTINIIIDGGGSAITTGIKGHVIIDFALEVLEWATVADQSGSVVVDVNRATFANYPTTLSIAGTELPTISTSTKGEDRTLTSWSDIDAGDVLEFEVDSITTLQRVTVALKCRKK